VSEACSRPIIWSGCGPTPGSIANVVHPQGVYLDLAAAAQTMKLLERGLPRPAQTVEAERAMQA
jgi:hypothetical protein